MNIKNLLIELFSIFLTIANPTPGQPSISSPKAVIYPEITLSSLFQEQDYMINDPSNQIITLITTGDVIPARSVNFKMTGYNDFTYPFKKTTAFLKDADLTLINLEAPLIENCPVTNEGMIFCGNQRFIEGLKFADIDVATIGNNHALNYGFDGLSQTVRLLETNGIAFAGFPQNGLSNLSVKEVKNKKIGFLAYNILDNPDNDIILSEIRNARNYADFLIVAYHWGAEYTNYPANETVKLAHLTIDSGADLVVGNHPHWIQPVEIYKDKLIIYSHGNFIFDQEWSSQTKTGILTKISISNNKIIAARFYPVFISDFSQAELLAGSKKEEIISLLKVLSQNHAQTLLENKKELN